MKNKVEKINQCQKYYSNDLCYDVARKIAHV